MVFMSEKFEGFEGIDTLNLKNNFYRSIVDGNSLKKFGDNNDFILASDITDPGRKYRYNSYGYRGPEFIKNAELVTAGCSFTHGTGVPEEAIWSNVVAENLKLNVNNISKPGASIGWIIEKLFNYFKEFGNPKHLLCLFPDAKRFIVPIDGKILTNDKEKNSGKNGGEPGTRGDLGQFLYNEVSKPTVDIYKTNFLKRPYNVREFYTAEIGYYNSIRQIRMLEQYCKEAKINLLWSTWDFEFSFHLKEINLIKTLKFNNYFQINTFFYRKKEKNELPKDAIFNINVSNSNEVEGYLNCCREHVDVSCSCFNSSCHLDLIEKYGEANFHVGSDITDNNWSHPGCHLQAHYADRFLEVFSGL